MIKIFQIPKKVLDLYTACHKKTGDFNARRFKAVLKQDSEIAQWFEEVSQYYSLDIGLIPTLVYRVSIQKGLKTFEYPRCKTCGKLLIYKQAKSGVVQYCCYSCAAKSEEVQKRSQETMLKRYGYAHALQNPESQKRFQETCLKRFGSKSPFSSEKIKQQIKETNLKKYGVEVPTQNKDVYKKVMDTCLKKYGTKHAAQSDIVKKKIEQTCLERYGTTSPLGSKEIQALSRATWMKTLGVDNPWKSDKIKKKIEEVNLARYGAKNPSQSPEVMARNRRTQRTNFYETFINYLKPRGITMLTSKEDYIDHKPLRFRCIHGHEWTNENNEYGDCYQHIACPECRKLQFKSDTEKILLDYIKSLYSGEILENSRKILKGKELDIYLPEKHLAFEFDGTLYHSEGYRPNNYHQQKSIQCNRLGIRLIHVFEYEWHFNQEKIKALIRSALGIFEKKIYARKCQVKEITSKEYEDFLYLYHLQGPVKSSTRFGLFYQDELVAVIGFGQSRFKKGELELHRYCVKSDYQIIGGFSKLIKHSGFNHFISYIDLSHYSGLGYKKIGFKLVSLTAPSYYYATGRLYYTRMQCQKHKLAKLLKKFDPALSESENMAMNGFFKVYDAGNLKVEYSV